MFTRLAKGAVYTGIDPTGKRGFLRILVTEMTREQLAAWLAIDAATASRYVIPEALRAVPVELPTLDNEPGQPVPKLQDHATATERKQSIKAAPKKR